MAGRREQGSSPIAISSRYRFLALPHVPEDLGIFLGPPWRLILEMLVKSLNKASLS